ncbi:integrase core domain-containing protein [Legionella yabuuchiae]|uniref:integrase core domain-containing protein n=1 Tax=Legionella yabuuchiae TaxID=376727 RepID=UPI001055D529|nr:integrase core domain-containing protein [Legionella yabuuchiae]
MSENCFISGAEVKQTLTNLFVEYGLPLALRSDNGVPFASHAVAGLSELSVWLIKLGIVPERIRKGHPEENGRHERMHLTLKKETASPPQYNQARQQQRFNAFRTEFNEQRPHEGLNFNRPAWLYTRNLSKCVIYAFSFSPCRILKNSQGNEPLLAF